MPKPLQPNQPNPISRSLELPDGYQQFSPWYKEGNTPNQYGVSLNSLSTLQVALARDNTSELRCYTQHEIFLEDNILKHTRTSPNWEGGLVTYSTCKHQMRTYHKPAGWVGTWIAGLCPASLGNCGLFVGMVQHQLISNFDLGNKVQNISPTIRQLKAAETNPRGDLYKWDSAAIGSLVAQYDHRNFLEPPNHTRSIEYYKKSPGSTSDREDGKIPKWWRDIEYISHNTRPPSFILSPCWLFSRPMWRTQYKPGRAVLKLTPALLEESLVTM